MELAAEMEAIGIGSGAVDHPNCLRCKRALKSQKAREIGYGKVCLSKVGGIRAIGSSVATKEDRVGMVTSNESIRSGIFARIQGELRVTNIPWRIISHSPDGFMWGYGGSGPADFALNIAEAVLLEIGYKGRRTKVKPGPDGCGRAFNLSFTLAHDVKGIISQFDMDKPNQADFRDIRRIATDLIIKEALENA